jgi:hypothetical protein
MRCKAQSSILGFLVAALQQGMAATLASFRKPRWLARFVVVAAALVSIFPTSFAQQPNPPRKEWFSDVTERAALKGVGGGRVAWGDYNHDGWLDFMSAYGKNNSSRLFP